MKGTALAVVVAVASADTCEFSTPELFQAKGARLAGFSCDVSEVCCSGLQDANEAVMGTKGDIQNRLGKDGGKGRFMKDFIGTCGRADQVSLYKCAVAIAPEMAPQGKGGKVREMIKVKGCPNAAALSGADGAGQCAISKGAYGIVHVADVSAGCCAAGNAMEDVDKARAEHYEKCSKMEVHSQADAEANMKCFRDGNTMFMDQSHAAACGMIGACGRQDQQSIVKFAKGKGKGDGALQLLETYKFSLSASQEMMASFMPSEVEDDETEGDETEDGGSQILTGLLGFMAGAAVTGLAVTVLRRRTPAQDEYNEIVA